jgi:hypothetical protein
MLDEKHEKIASPKTEVKPHLLMGPWTKSQLYFITKHHTIEVKQKHSSYCKDKRCLKSPSLAFIS